MRRRWNLMHRAVYTLLLIMKQFSSGRKNHGKLHPALEQLQNVAVFHRFLTRELINELIFVIHLIDNWSTFTYKQDVLYIIFHGKTLFQKHRFHSSKAISRRSLVFFLSFSVIQRIQETRNIYTLSSISVPTFNLWSHCDHPFLSISLSFILEPSQIVTNRHLRFFLYYQFFSKLFLLPRSSSNKYRLIFSEEISKSPTIEETSNIF